LSTIDAEEGTPYGSVVECADMADGRVLMLLSDLAQHTTNLGQDASASIIVADGLGEAMALSQERVTLMGEVDKLEPSDALRETYLEAHPHASGYIDFDDFHYFALSVERVRYIGGFGRMSWIPIDEYLEAEPDPLLPHRDDIVDHMNEDHADALVEMVHHLEGETWAESAIMTGVDRLGFGVAALGTASDDDASDTRRETLRFDFDQPAESPGEVRARMVQLTERARKHDAEE
jgi:putative heme iron utilization protein